MSLWNSNIWNSAMWGGGGSSVAGGSPVTAGGLIYNAYRALGVLRPGQSTSPEGMADALSLLNDIVDSWNTERLMVPSMRRDVYELTAGVCTYTLGPGGSLTGERPQRVEGAALVSCNCGCGCADGNCGDLRLASGCGSGIHVDTAYPNVNIRINPAPQAGQSLAIQTWQTLSGFTDLNTPYGFPPGYALALRWNLAHQLAPLAVIMMKIPQSLLQRIESEAVASKAAVKSLHSSPPPELSLPSGLGCCHGSYDIYSDC